MRMLRLALAVVLLAGGVWAQQRRQGAGRPPRANVDVLDRLEQMTPEQRERFLDRLPPGRRARIEQRLREYEKLSQDERRRLRRQYMRFRQLSPEEQESARKLFQAFQQLPEERRLAVRQEYVRLSRMSHEDRLAAVHTPEYGSTFTPEERRILSEMLELAPN